MKSRLVKILLFVLALCTVLAVFPSCAKDGEDDGGTVNTIETSEEEEYVLPDEISFSDGELNILNFDKYYNAIIYIDTDDTTTKVTKSVYARNRDFEETYGVKVVEEKHQFIGREQSFPTLTNAVSTASLAGDDIYDIVYVSLSDQQTLLTSGMLKNLNDVSTLNLDEKWWDRETSASYILEDGKTYVASSPLNLMSYEMSWVVLFNKKMTEELSVANLFDYVRAGEWTIEKMLQIIRQYGVISTNSDGSYTYDPNGTARYGIAVHNASPGHFLMGSGIDFIQAREDGTVPYKYGCSNSDTFSTVSDLLLQLFDRSAGMAIGSDYEDDVVNHPEGYVPVFGRGDALFLNCELKSGMTLKKIIASEVDYGILPVPKYSADQKSYITDMANSTMMLAIPAINDEAEMTGLAADVLSYLSYRDVLPVYYGEYVSYQNANDPDSLEMLDTYIMPGRTRDKGMVYGWTKSLIASYNAIIYNEGKPSGGISLANILNAYAKTINAEIKSFYGK